MTGAEFQERLDVAFHYEGVKYGRLALVEKSEVEYKIASSQFGGHVALSHAFKSVFLESIELLNTYCRPRVKTPLSEHYPQFLPRMSNSFHTLCGAECAAVNGYSSPAFTTLRNVFDDVVLVSAALQKVTDFYRIEGINPTEKFDPNTFTRNRKNEERRVRPLMTGSGSGLDSAVITELDKLNQLFDFEVHGGRLSLANSIKFMKGAESLQVLPQFNPKTFALFMNRFTEVSWAVHRLVPAVQPPEAPMPKEWADRWALVDNSFEIAVRSLSDELGMKVGDAYAEFINAKFPFDASSVFPL